ncbi:MAG: hypothetical protein AUJ54_12705 [Ignavibacteria bacterium CG1_02_37_35]|nr:DUF3160 domain-containing protein [Ignavibacteria bacterium]OIO15544.1 MAG: hypothetical protein AUJ54_12705 [Ignavibacteria bacterium CG1_02_37_35]PJC60741.1 MAG: hypothetical protein CO025_02290 [Ignavibacteria bacterium CG_4_9_14_0_2_um_filter_37_13]
MKNLALVFTMFTLSFLACPTFSQSNTFSVEAYKQFLETHQNMDGGELMQMHDAGTFLNHIPAQTQNVLYMDSIAIKYELTDYEKSLIEKNGFMVTERLKTTTLGDALRDIFYKDLPLFISTDAILHSLHFSYDKILKDVELGYIIPKLTDILDKLQKQIPALKTQYATQPEMTKSIEDVDLYIGLTNLLLTDKSDFTFSKNVSKADSLIEMIKSLGMEDVDLFSEHCRKYDFSQLKVRGHYTDEMQPKLGKYFQAMMWLGRTEFYLIPPRADTSSGCSQTKYDIQRQIIDALLLSKLMNFAGVQSSFDEIDGIIEFFVGKSDNVTLNNLVYLQDKLQITDPSELLDLSRVNDFQNELKKNEFAYQRILSQVLVNNGVDSIVPASSFLLLGQRFIIDSYVFSQVVYDRINYKGEFIRRMLPNSLDVLFALGNNASAQLLQNELEQYHYSTNLASLRYLTDAYSDEFWNSSMYNSWLNAIRTINPPKEREQLPAFMKTAAYWQSKMNTQLASWAQLRHDNLLYAKQSYTGVPFCSYPFVYVEPFLSFYKDLNSYASIALQKFQSISFGNAFYKESIIYYFKDLLAISDTLGIIAKKELNKEMLSDAEKHFLQTTLSLALETPYVQREFDGWFPRLFYWTGIKQFDLDEINHFVVADVHTAPSETKVKHVGTGPFNLGVWIANNNENQPTAFVGPALSYYEYTSTNFLRLTDEEWNAQYLSTSPRPSFVNSYLADSSGNTKGNGAMLFTSIERNDNPNSSMNYLTAQNYPNPFNPSTIISFTIPEAMARQNVSLKIYSINGELIKTFFEKELPAGNYVTRWDGMNETGTAVPSGVYLYKLTAGSSFVTGKMSLVK